jgi:hypothetical protein
MPQEVSLILTELLDFFGGVYVPPFQNIPV